jgi:hypothetical protein
MKKFLLRIFFTLPEVEYHKLTKYQQPGNVPENFAYYTL